MTSVRSPHRRRRRPVPGRISRTSMWRLVLFLCCWSTPVLFVKAGTTINAANPYAFGANFGWINWRGDDANGAVIGEYVCSGSIYAANVGWIRLGSGAPANGIQYQNISANDFG